MGYYEIVVKNNDDDWEAKGDNFKTLKNAIKYAKTIKKDTYKTMDIYLIINEDLKAVYDQNGKER